MNQIINKRLKWALTSLIIVLISSALVGQNRENQEAGLKALDEHYGFLNIKLESPFNSFQGLKNEDSEKSIFKATQAELKIDKFNFESVYLTFYKESLTTIELETKGWNNTNGVLGILQETYGAGNKKIHFGYKWKGEKVWMNFAIDETNGNGVLSLYSVPMMTREIGENE